MISFVALYQETVPDLVQTLKEVRGFSYDGLAVPLVNPLFPREFLYEPLKSNQIVFSRSDLLFSPEDWLSYFISVLNSNIDCDSKNENVRRQSEAKLKQEIAFSEHVIQSGHTMIKLKSSDCTNLARIVSTNVKGTILIHIPMISKDLSKQTFRRDIDEDDLTQGEDTWNMWNKFRMVADFHPRIKLALELCDDIPSQNEVWRWLGEPVECIVIPHTLFRKNKDGNPVLSSAHLNLIKDFLQNNIHFIITGNIDDHGTKLYAEYIKKFVLSNQITDQMKGLDDVLEIPLQPLFDNLDCYTYEVFERDPVKYKYYQNAIEAALIDKVPDNEINKKTIIVMVVGAGRGPLVRAAINASINSKRKIKIFIVEKNPNVIVTLKALVEEIWPSGDIELFHNDMRDLQLPQKADILVSELLGSFGDNELSPECLDGAQKHLKKDGISIPCKYTSYLNPIMSSKIYNNIRSILLEKFSAFKDKYPTTGNNFESTFVVYLKNVFHIDEPRSLFEFKHPNRRKTTENSRYKALKFNVWNDCVLHGFAGYFDTVLYKDIKLSIHPKDHTQGLLSWFPCFFPLTEPQLCSAGDTIEVEFRRCVSSFKVWYEWNTISPKVSIVHNRNGIVCPIYK
ncbi:protein arginine N-methyltransferase 5 [Condylostylus longicornis]|uniref:protein arginine N-methyltransferase 5 n=1 Tax=Condylostylus longicornis TaxID=2530218 RepID=UPI00244DBEE0|nr:protein arginine N-methyltransferase 5 [Condylostylus longicornis]